MPELILFNGKLFAPSPASALAIGGGKIMAAGDDETIKSLARRHTRLIDLEGRRVLPGLTDGHFHLCVWALGRKNLALAGAKSLAEVLAALAERVRVTPAGNWIEGGGWNESEWDAPVLPSRADLDAVSPEHPVILRRSDLHAAVVNSRALALAHLGADTPNPPGGVIDRDERGQPTGILRELAIDLVSGIIPPATDAQLAQALQDGIAYLHTLGLTGVHDQRLMSVSESVQAWRVYQQLRAEQKLKFRLTANIHYSQLPHAVALGLKSGFGDDYVRFGFVKLFTDGSMGAHTAWMLEPYEDGGVGMPAMPPAQLAEVISTAGQHGWAVSVHAIGDRANRELLDIFERVTPTLPPPPFPHRVEHAQLLHPADISRFARLGLTVSAQPIHLVDDRVLADRIWGQRSRYAYAFRSLLQHRTRLAFGSDCPVADPNPWLGIYAAVKRHKPGAQAEGSWYAEERLTVAEAIHGYTLANAEAVGQQAQAGSLHPGKLADLVVVEQDILNPAQPLPAQVLVRLTMVGGEIVYQA